MNSDSVSRYCHGVCRGLFSQNNVLKDIIRHGKDKSLGKLAQSYVNNEEKSIKTTQNAH